MEKQERSSRMEMSRVMVVPEVEGEGGKGK